MAIATGKLDEAVIDDNVRRLLQLLVRTESLQPKGRIHLVRYLNLSSIQPITEWMKNSEKG